MAKYFACWASWVLLLAVTVAVVAPARAQPAASTDPGGEGHEAGISAPNCSPLSLNEARLEARKLLDSAVHTSGARARLGYLEAAYRLYQDPVILFNMGSLLFDEGKKPEGADLLRRYLHEAGDTVPQARRDKLTRLLTKNLGTSAELELNSEPCAFVYIDHRLVGRVPLSLAIWLHPGPHLIEVEHDHRRAQQTLRVPSGRTHLEVPLPSSVVLLPEVPRHAQRLLQTAAEGAEAEGLTVITGKARDAILARSAGLRGCLGAHDCQEELAHQLDAQYVLSLRGEQDRNDWRLVATLLDVGAGVVSVSQEAGCTECTEDQAAGRLGTLVREVVHGGLKRIKGTLEVRAVPEAEVLVDARRLGRTPFLRAQLAGRHVVELRAVGYEDHKQTVEIGEGQKLPLDVRLKVAGPPVQAAPPAEPPPRIVDLRGPGLGLGPTAETAGRRPRWRLALGGLALGVGVGLVSLGATALILDGQCGPSSVSSQPVAPAQACDQSYHSLAPGAAMLTGGIAVVLAGAVMLAWPGPGKPQKARLALLARPAP